MPIPQVTDRIKEAPAVALRAVFAGVGQLLMVVDKIRAQMQEQATSPAPGGEKGSSAGPPGGPPDKSGNVAQLHERPTRAAHVLPPRPPARRAPRRPPPPPSERRPGQPRPRQRHPSQRHPSQR